MKRKISYIIILFAVVISFSNCKKEEEEIITAKLNTGFCSQMKLVDTLNAQGIGRMFVTNENIYVLKKEYGVDESVDQLLIVDFEGNYDSICIKDIDGSYLYLEEIFVSKSEKIYIDSPDDIIKLDKFGNEISRYDVSSDFVELGMFYPGSFQINEDNNSVIYAHRFDTVIRCYSYSSFSIINSFPYIPDTILYPGSENGSWVSLKTDYSNNIYIETNNVINIYDESGVYLRAHEIESASFRGYWDTWHNGYIVKDKEHSKIIFRDVHGNVKGTLRDDGWFGLNYYSQYCIEVSPNDSTIVVRNGGKLYIYKVSE